MGETGSQVSGSVVVVAVALVVVAVVRQRSDKSLGSVARLGAVSVRLSLSCAWPLSPVFAETDLWRLLLDSISHHSTPHPLHGN